MIETLEENFGTLNDKTDLGSAIIDTVYTNIQDNMQDYLEELKAVVPKVLVLVPKLVPKTGLLL